MQAKISLALGARLLTKEILMPLIKCITDSDLVSVVRKRLGQQEEIYLNFDGSNWRLYVCRTETLGARTSGQMLDWANYWANQLKSKCLVIPVDKCEVTERSLWRQLQTPS